VAPPAATASATPRRAGFDRGFAEVVREGYMTVQEAIARGCRETYALDLQRRFGLTPELAIRVTDNRMRIAAALREMERQRLEKEALRPARWHVLVVILLFIVLAALTGSHRWTRERNIGRELERRSLANGSGATASAGPLEAEPEPAPGPPPRIEIARHDNGWVTRVTASHPEEALASFCATLTHAGTCATMQTGPTLPESAGRRLGWFMLNNASLTTWSVQISRQRGTGRWSVGTGLRPIEPFSLGAPADGGTSEWPFIPAPDPGHDSAAGDPARPGSPDRS